MKKILTCFLTIIILTTLISCANKQIEKEIIGYWLATETEDAVILEFTDNNYTFVGVSSSDLSGDTFEGTYKIDENEGIINLEYEGADVMELTYSYDEDNELYLELYDVKFVKSKK